MSQTRLTEEKLEEILKSTHELDPIVVAINQIMNDILMDESRNALLADLNAESRAYNCGRAASIFDFKMMLIEKGLKLS